VSSDVDLRELADRLADAARPAVDSVVVMQWLDSTHACSLRLIEQAETEEIELPPTLIVAHQQASGVGRSGRTWDSPEGGLYLNWVSAGVDPEIIARLPMVAAAACCEAVDRLGVEGTVIKWPNDLLVDGRKLAGILIHTRRGCTNWVSIGLGINLKLEPGQTSSNLAGATTLADHIETVDPILVSEQLVRVFIAELAAGIADPEPSIARWRDRLHHQTGEEMTVRLADGSTTDGTFAGVSDDGHLRLEIDGEVRVISSADVVE
jgi:BirA family biotin operon repressor/biotin-[acetyl-CoA-carboxylase] ligase